MDCLVEPLDMTRFEGLPLDPWKLLVWIVALPCFQNDVPQGSLLAELSDDSWRIAAVSHAQEDVWMPETRKNICLLQHCQVKS